MKIPTTPVKGWSQLALFPEPAYELILKVGLVPEGDHAQFQLEVKSASTHELLALSSRPHVDLARADEELTNWVLRLRDLMHEYAGPFPPG